MTNTSKHASSYDADLRPLNPRFRTEPHNGALMNPTGKPRHRHADTSPRHAADFCVDLRPLNPLWRTTNDGHSVLMAPTGKPRHRLSLPKFADRTQFNLWMNSMTDHNGQQ